MEIAVLGGGSWGSALSMHLARLGHTVRIWEFFEKQAKKMQCTRSCPFLPKSNFPDTVTISSNMEEVVRGCGLLFIVVPSTKVEETITQAAEFLDDQPVVICSKGFAVKDGEFHLLSEIVEDAVDSEVYCLYGPTHAEEVCRGMYTGVVLAGSELKDELKDQIKSPNFRVDVSGDMVGVQVCAALKNAVALFVGIVSGLELGDNARAYIMTKGLDEIREIGLAMGAQQSTFIGLAGMGDVVVTSMSEHSRNRHVGEQIGKGRSLKQVLAEMDMVAEGVAAVKFVPGIVEEYELDLPVLSGLYGILFKRKSPQKVLRTL